MASAAAAFVLTAAAFLVLANLGLGPSERSLEPGPNRAKAGPALDLSPDDEQLSALRERPDQRLDVAVENTSGEDLTNVTVTLRVSSENTALPDDRYYRKTLPSLPAGETSAVRLRFDLSPPETATNDPSPSPEAPQEEPRRILEMRATTPEGVYAVKTAVLPV